MLVLIDTWWNVNVYRIRFSFRDDILVLIDTWWNVNVIMQGQLLVKLPVLIDTWWNVNLDKWFWNLEKNKF